MLGPKVEAVIRGRKNCLTGDYIILLGIVRIVTGLWS
jgi:hypothetical protein